MAKVPAFAQAFAGRWRLVEMDTWGSDVLDLVEEAHLTFTGASGGKIVFGALQGLLDVRYGSRDGSACAEFSWQGHDDNDPARGLFTAASGNFPGASGGQLTDARALYGLLTGRVASVTGQATLNENTGEYELLGRRRRAGKLNNYHVFLQDSWQTTPTRRPSRRIGASSIDTTSCGIRYDSVSSAVRGSRRASSAARVSDDSSVAR